jgi:hypothetical protein
MKGSFCVNDNSFFDVSARGVVTGNSNGAASTFAREAVGGSPSSSLRILFRTNSSAPRVTNWWSNAWDSSVLARYL